MRIVLYDVQRETLDRFEKVISIANGQTRISGRICNCWFIDFDDGTNMVLKQKDYRICKIIG